QFMSAADSDPVASLAEGLSHTKLATADSSDAEDAAASDGRLLSFADRGLKLDSAEAATEVTEALGAGEPDVAALDLSGNTIGVAAAEAIGLALARHSCSLRRLLWKDTFTGRLKTEIGPALSAMTRQLALPDSGARLTEIDLCDIAFGPNGVVGVTDLLASPACFSLRVLRMNNEGLGHQGCRLLSDALSRGIDASEAAGRPLRLREFSAGRNRLENAGVDMLAGPLSRMASLRKLELYQDGIGIHGPEGAQQLAAIVAANPHLRCLNLSDNSIKPDGAQLLADALRKLPKLTELNLADCLLLSDGAQAIADALDEALCPSLRSLIISGNEINRDAALAVAAAAAGKPSLRLLDLNANAIGPEGIELIRQHVSASGSAELASFSDDEGEDDGEEGDEDDEEAEEEEGDGGDRGAEEDEVEAATAGLSIGGGGAGNRSLFDNVPELGLSGCSLFGGGSASSKPAAPAGSGGGVVAFSFKAAAAVTPAAEKPAGSEVGQPLLRPGRLSAGGGRSDGESSAAASLVDRLLTSPATFKLGEDGLASLGPEPGPRVLRAALSAPDMPDRCQRLVAGALALSQQSDSAPAESAAAGLLQAAMKSESSAPGGWVQAVLTECGLIKCERLRNRRRPCELARTAPFWRALGQALAAVGESAGEEQRRCLAACLEGLWPRDDKSPAASAKQSLVGSLAASA
ncbi:hypothetical protein BOX15_Mlig006584g1, partial [Macrostomum lignano]